MKNRLCILGKGWFFAASAVAIMAIQLPAAWGDSFVHVKATFDNSQPNATLTTGLESNYNDNTFGAASSTTPVGVFAGIYNFKDTVISGPNAPTIIAAENALGITASNKVFQAVCIDFTHNIGFGQSSEWTIENLSSVTKSDNGVGISNQQAAAIGWLWANKFPSNLINTPNPEQAAIFQMAVWDLLYSHAYSNQNSPAPSVNYSQTYPGGSSTISTTDVSNGFNLAADAWSAVQSGTPDNNVFALVDTDDTQNFTFGIVGVTPLVETAIVPVPLPASAGVGFSMIAGFGGLALLRKRFVRKNRIA